MFEVGKATHTGLKRKDHPNQDQMGDVFPGLFNRKPPIVILADGMGGYEGGAIASKLVVDTIKRDYRKAGRRLDYQDLLREIIIESHLAIKNKVINQPKISKMGSTVVAAILDDKNVYVGNVGDSRAYIIHQKKIKQVSYDHSFVGELVRQGAITPEQGLVHPKRNILTMSITAQRSEINPFVHKYEIERNDKILLCSDGLWGVVESEKMLEVINHYSPQIAANKLIDMANENSGPDNISVIIAKLK